MTDDETIKMSLAETLAFIKKADVTIYDECVKAIAELGEEAAKLARDKAEEQGFAAPGKSGRGTGALLEDIGYSTRGPIAILKETAVNKKTGYKYPAVFEFGRKSEWMDRPFLFPAIRDLEPEAFTRLEEAIQTAIRRLDA